jgi:hypothetical protein
VAVTVKVYDCPGVSPYTVHDVALLEYAVQVRLPGVDVTVKFVMEEPPLSLGSCQETATAPCVTVLATALALEGLSGAEVLGEAHHVFEYELPARF